MKRLVKRLALTVALALAMAATAWSSPIILSGSSATNPWGVVDLSGGPFWANPSFDGNHVANVGYYLSGTPGSSVPNFYDNSPYAFMPYLGGGSTTFNWLIMPGTPVSALQSVTAWNDIFGLEPTGTPNVYTLTLQTPHNVWRSDTLDGGRAHFAAFQGSDAWYVGVEDMTWGQGADWDYNDLVVKIPDPTPVPEPGSTLAMLGLGLVAIARQLRRRA